MKRQMEFRYILFLFCILSLVPFQSAAEEDISYNFTDGNNNTNTTESSKSDGNPFISEVAGPLLLVTTILFFLSILYVLVCLCLIRCGSVRFDPVHYPDGRIYFCVGVKYLASWCYLPLCGGNASAPRNGNAALSEFELRSSPPPPAWLSGDHSELISSMEDFGVYIPIFDRVGRKKALETLLDHSDLFYDTSTRSVQTHLEVRSSIIGRSSASQHPNEDPNEEYTERSANVGRMICLRNRGEISSNMSKRHSDIPQDRPEKMNTVTHHHPNPDDEESSNHGMEEVNLESIDNHASTCPICLEELDNGHTNVSNPSVCNHTFHRDCLVEWLSNNHASCPCCRMDWVSNVMLWEALRWALLREIEEEREKRKEEKRIRRMQRRQNRKCIRQRVYCCWWCEDGAEARTASHDIETSNLPDVQQQQNEGDDSNRISSTTAISPLPVPGGSEDSLQTESETNFRNDGDNAVP